ncbi:hypothetical protein KKH36_03825 [Patescibacteria group bacterium]|nr:hypothetical protein [Patescibacteria group bacterium]
MNKSYKIWKNEFKQSIKNVFKYTFVIFILGLIFFGIGGIKALSFYLLFLVCLSFGIIREIEKKIQVFINVFIEKKIITKEELLTYKVKTKDIPK